MRPPAISLIRFLRYLLAALVITLAGNSGILRAQQKTAPAQEKPKIRAITAFINLDRAQYKEQVGGCAEDAEARADDSLNRADTRCKRSGSRRSRFRSYTAGLTTEQAVAFSSSTTRWRQRKSFAASIGPAMVKRRGQRFASKPARGNPEQHENVEREPGRCGEDGVRWKRSGRGGSRDEKTRGDGAQARAIFILPRLRWCRR